ncbi:bifunctional metallophosphatase/5'-nucleotidase [Roseibium limicola]|uniref:5'-nucleotidase C-terminal domain-containing protein n=1 Tax=Roseibium limicola TaxID=2816037 RepID=A0A939J8J4_9HYPH|nr:5'-nucleotidase C-terminal domain-containing protein [Roseibium limicola]MBO0345381.1 5'-nucleotidase C-terminal domain-containing protein [Roseibium limicola]
MSIKWGVAALAAGTLLSSAALADYKITILHTNDFHSRIEPINKYDSGCSEEDDAEGKCFGGSARLETLIKERRGALDNSLLVDGGDQFQGSLFYTYYKGKVAAEMMNTLGYDAMTVGNHEFDDGPEVLRGFMDAVGFPILLSNADVSKEPQLADVLKPSTVIEKNGEKIGLIGLTPADTHELSSPGPNVSFSDPIAAVKAEIEKFSAEGINKIVVLSHSGYEVDKALAAGVSGIDVIVGGHSNTYLSNTSDKAKGAYPTWVDTPEGGKTAIVQAYAYGKFLGELNVTFDDAGVVTEAVGEPIVVDGQIVENAELKDRIKQLAEPLDEIRQEVIGHTSEAIEGSRDVCRAMECSMGNLVAEAMLDRVKAQGVQIAIQNGGGLRSSIDSGDITMGEVLTVLPFQNTLATFLLPGSGVVEALENGVSQIEEGAGRFPQVAGLKFSVDASKPAGERIGDVMVGSGDSWAPIDPAKVYGVVSNNYMRGGGDGYSVFDEKGEEAYDYGPNLEKVVAEFIAKSNGYKPFTDGRIVIK